MQDMSVFQWFTSPMYFEVLCIARHFAASHDMIVFRWFTFYVYSANDILHDMSMIYSVPVC